MNCYDSASMAGYNNRAVVQSQITLYNGSIYFVVSSLQRLHQGFFVFMRCRGGAAEIGT